MKKIALTKGYYALLDDEDYETVSKFAWHAVKNRAGQRYAYRHKTSINPYSAMHRMVMSVQDPAVLVDHKNGNGLDNQKRNLRTATKSQNTQNSRARNGKEYKGTYKNSKARTYFSLITHKGVSYYLGSFYTPEEAAHAYDNAAKKKFGRFARLNFPEEAAA